MSSAAKFENILFEEKSVQSTANIFDEVDKWDSWATFYMRNIKVPGATDATVLAEWNNIIDVQQHHCIWARGQWNVPRFKGLERRKRQRTENEICASRSATIEDAETLQQRWQAGLGNINRFHNSIMDVQAPRPSNQPLVPDLRPEDQPSLPPVQNVVHEAIAREANININMNIHINIDIHININIVNS